MPLTYNQVKAELAAASALTGGKFVAFDAEWYVRTYQNTPIVFENAGLDQDRGLAHFSGDPLDHYVQYGAAAGLQPTSWFNTAYYRAEYADVRNMGDADVLVHYAKFGVNEGRAPNQAMEFFDGTRYLAENPDVVNYVNANLAQFGGSTTNGAIAHFIKFGSLEQRIGYDIFGARQIITRLPEISTLAPTDVGNGVIQLSANTNTGLTMLTGNKAVADGTASPTLRLVGDADIRLNFTNKADQIDGLDLNGNNVIQANGVENNIRGANILTAKNFTTVDAYPRNPLNEGDRSQNYLGDISYDGSGYAGNGTNTNGNIFLGGMGADFALGGVGNDFLAGGGLASTVPNPGAAGLPAGTRTNDFLSGGRNADFFFTELSLLSPVDGSNAGNGSQLRIDGGNTADNSPAGGTVFDPVAISQLSSQDSDWLLLESSDDDEPVLVGLTSVTGAGTSTPTSGTGDVTTRAGASISLEEVENVDASGDLYGFLNKTGATVGARNAEVNDGRLPAHTFGAENFGVGSTAQLQITGSGEANKLIGGYDNDNILGGGSGDLIMGGKLSYLLNNRNNPNLLTADGKGLELNVNSVGTVNDGRDRLFGDTGNDGIVFEMDGGEIDGGSGLSTSPQFQPALVGDVAQSDTLYITNFSMGRTKGWTSENELVSGSAGESGALAALTNDSAIRLDLGVGHGQTFRGYGGADVKNNFIAGALFTADQTQYKAGVDRTTVQDIENVIATGLGNAQGSPAVDFLSAGGNGAADQINAGFRNQQNFFGTSTAVYDLRGVDSDDEGLGALTALATDTFQGDSRTYNGVYRDTSFGFGSGGVASIFFERGDNTLYAGNKNDNLEGRRGDDNLMGGLGDDTFFVSLTRGDDFDVIHRQVDANVDNIWDNTFSQDFRVKGQNIAGTPTKITFNVENPDAVQGVSVTYAGVVVNAGGADVIAATTLAGLATAINSALQAIDKNVTAAVEGTKLVVVDATGRNASSASLAGDPAFKNGLESVVQGTGTSTSDELDRLVFKAYEDATQNVGVDDTIRGLGGNAYAKDLVVDFNGGTTTLSEGQQWRIQFQNLNSGDKVSVDINGKKFEATVNQQYDGSTREILGDGVDNDLDGTIDVAETTDQFVTRFTEQFNARQLDTSSRAGDVTAGATADVFTGSTSERVLVLTETPIVDGREHVFMRTPVVSITNSAGTSPGTVRLAENSNTTVELYQYDGRNGGLNANDVLFVGQTGATKNYDPDSNLRTEDGSVYSWATLQTAATSGGALTGKAASTVTVNSLVTELHGHDLLIGGDGADDIKGLGGDDTIIGSKGADAVDGGVDAGVDTKQRFVVDQLPITTDANKNKQVDYNDTLLYREQDFGDGSSFTIALDGALTSRGKGTVTALDTKGAALGVTTYNEIELVRTLNNTRNDALDFVALSNSVAVATGVSAEPTEGVVVNLEQGSSDITYNVDLNNDNTLFGPTELGVLVGRVAGVENLFGGNANDQVKLDQTQLDANNLISLGNQINDTTPAGTAVEGADTVTYTNTAAPQPALLNTALPTVTIRPESGTNTDTVTFAGNVLPVPSSDTLIDVEVVNVLAVAVNTKAADTLDLSGIAGATVNFSNAVGQGIGEQFGGDLSPALTIVANVEANTLEAGGVTKTGGSLGIELLEVVGISQLEVVKGSTGADRVIVSDASGLTNARSNQNVVAGPQYDDQGIGFNFHAAYPTGTFLNTARTFDTSTTKLTDNKGLYTFDLGDGDDTVDYRTIPGSDDVAVVVDFTATNSDWVVVDDTAGGGFSLTIQGQSRVDKTVNVERYYGAVNAPVPGQRNAIDLSRATEAVTVIFGAEQLSSLNEVTEPNGRNTTITGLDLTVATPANQVTGISVSTTANVSAVVGRFMQASAIANVTGEALWNFVEGSNQNDTVVMSATQDRLKDEVLNLRGGANTVDYTNGTVAGKIDAYTATLNDTAVLNPTSSTSTHAIATVQHGDVTGFAGKDTISIDRQYDADKSNIEGGLTLIGSANTDDTVTIAGFFAPQTTGALNGLKSIVTGIKIAIPEVSKLVDVMGKLGGGHNLVDLGSGAGSVNGSAVQDVKLNVAGQTNVNDNILTNIRGWENATGSDFNDRLFGNDNANVMIGGLLDDVLQGRGGGDTLSGDATDVGGLGNDRFVYIGAGDGGHILGNKTVAATLIDFITDFDDGLGEDLLVLDATVGVANGGFNFFNTTVQSKDFAAAPDLANGAVVLLQDAGVLANSGLLVNTASVVAGLTNGAVFGTNTMLNTSGTVIQDKQQVLFVMSATDRVGMVLWTASSLGDLTIDSTELQVLTELDDLTVGALDADDVFVAADLAIRVGATIGKQTINLNPGLRDEVVYSSLNQSQYGSSDTIGSFDADTDGPGPDTGALQFNFVSGVDKIDLSRLNLGASNGLLINDIIVRNQSGPATPITDANAPNFFFTAQADSTSQQRAVVVEFDRDDIDGTADGTQAKARIFVDLDGDGQLSTTFDMFIDVAIDAVSTTPVYTDFIFVI